jgi:hypothetical protein
VARRQTVTPLGLLSGAIVAACPLRVHAQACCAGASAVTPGRLEIHEMSLVGTQLRAASVLGSYFVDSTYHASPPGTPEFDLEEDVFGAVRVLGNGQIALLVPFEETYRRTPIDGGHFGGGVGDVNASARYDFVLAGQSRVVPGIALLAGVTLPTGTPPDAAHQPLVVDETGIGAYQASAALALEQTFGPWLANATAMVAKRTERAGETLGTQFTFLAAGAYAFPNDAALALSVSYAFEGDATTSTGADVPQSARRLAVVSVSGLWPLSDTWRASAATFLDPPISSIAANQPAQAGFALTLIRSWM